MLIVIVLNQKKNKCQEEQKVQRNELGSFISLLQKAVKFISKSDALKCSQTKLRFEIVIRGFNRTHWCFVNKSFFCVIVSLFSLRRPSQNQYNVTMKEFRFHSESNIRELLHTLLIQHG